MPRNGSATREKILDSAQQLLLDHGYAGMSVDNLIERTGITKGGFFYHFKSKSALADALIARYAKEDRHHYEEAMARAESLSRDPLQQLLIFVGLFVEMMSQLEEVYPGCLYAAYCYQSGLLEEGQMETVADSMRYWRKHVSAKLEEVLEQYTPRIDVDINSLADFLLTTFEGAFILSKTLGEPKLVAAQLQHYRNYLETLFEKKMS